MKQLLSIVAAIVVVAVAMFFRGKEAEGTPKPGKAGAPLVASDPRPEAPTPSSLVAQDKGTQEKGTQEKGTQDKSTQDKSSQTDTKGQDAKKTPATGTPPNPSTGTAKGVTPPAKASGATPTKGVATTKTPTGPSRVLVKLPGGKTEDIGPTLDRIAKGIKHEHRNDGSTFGNFERRLPVKPRGYYREYVHPTPGQRGPGARRVVKGKAGEVYYTHDHYKSFVKVR